MSIDFTEVTAVSIPEGDVAEIQINGETVWTAGGGWGGLVFKAEENSTVYFSVLDEELDVDMEYSDDEGETWKTMPRTLETSVIIAAGDKIWIRGTNDAVSEIGSPSRFKISGKISASGSIMSLLDGIGESKTIPADSAGAFASLFQNCSALVQAPSLPATGLSRACYLFLFNNCTELVNPPELPAEYLAPECYCQMFEGCTKLVRTPDLDSIDLADSCYTGMFRGCTSLTQASDLPAGQVPDDAIDVYANMFEGCTSLRNPPELHLIYKGVGCYKEMFLGCTSLTRIAAGPMGFVASSCFKGMYKNCTALAESINQLPDIELAGSCYEQMFMGCTSLRAAPNLPAQNLVSSCYTRMFDGCSRLNITEDTGKYMVFNCPSTTPENVQYMFQGTGGSFTGSPRSQHSYYWNP